MLLITITEQSFSVCVTQNHYRTVLSLCYSEPLQNSPQSVLLRTIREQSFSVCVTQNHYRTVLSLCYSEPLEQSSVCVTQNHYRTVLSLCYSEPLQNSPSQPVLLRTITEQSFSVCVTQNHYKSLVNIPSSYDNKTNWWRTLCSAVVRLCLKCDGTRAETRFRLSAKRTVHLNRHGGRQFSRLPAAEVCTSAVVMLDTPCSDVVWRVLAAHCIRQFPPSLPLPYVTVRHHISTGVYNRVLLTALGVSKGNNLWLCCWILNEYRRPEREFSHFSTSLVLSLR